MTESTERNTHARSIATQAPDGAMERLLANARRVTAVREKAVEREREAQLQARAQDAHAHGAHEHGVDEHHHHENHHHG
jgi:hypothetical protein